MNSFDTHVCIVSAQPLPNYLPAVSPQIGREKIVLLESPSMQTQADILEAALSKQKRHVTRYRIDDKSNLALFRSQVEQILAAHPNAALNATGGLKTMSLIAYEVFRAANRPVFYSERDNRIIWLNPIENAQQKILGVLNIDDYLATFGQNVLACHRQALTNDGGEAMLHKLNTLPKAGPGDQARVGEKFESLVFRATQNALQQLPNTGVQDVAWGVKIGGEARDEFDVVIARNNTLYLIECKNVNNVDGFNSFLNKLDTLKRKRGLTARAALITTAHISKNSEHIRRAQESRILLLDEHDLPQLTEKLKLWLTL